jgi:hypothetical protein
MPIVTLSFEDDSKRINIRADHVVALSRITDDGPRPYTCVEPRRGMMDMRTAWHVYDSDKAFECNAYLWREALLTCPTPSTASSPT